MHALPSEQQHDVAGSSCRHALRAFYLTSLHPQRPSLVLKDKKTIAKTTRSCCSPSWMELDAVAALVVEAAPDL